MNFIRFFSHSTALQSANKSALGLLRKKAGYSLSNCRKALELHENDPAKAEQWLKEQAKAMGWAKVQKLEGRQASQGLIGVSAKDKKAVLVEVNCETDFVARNNQFKSLVASVVRSCFNHPVEQDGHFSKKIINGDELSKLKSPNGQLLENEVAILVGNIGENIILKRAALYEVFEKNLNIAVDVHPPTSLSNDILLGKYGSVVIYETNEKMCIDKDVSTQNIGVQLCKHVIGMNPRIIGEYNKDAVTETKEEEAKPEVNESKQEGEEIEYDVKRDTVVEEAFVNQDFLLDANITVGQFLEDHATEIYAFDRFECGEIANEEEKVPNEEIQEPAKKMAQ